MTPLSAVMITYNEERDLPAALESLRFCDEIVVVDAGSSDRTREVAQAMGARVVVSAPWPGFVEQRNRALTHARNDWVLCLDADEHISPALRDEIQEMNTRGFACAAYRIPRVTHYLGRWIRGTDWYPDHQVRLFDRGHGRWEGGAVHESFRSTGKIGTMRHPIEHHPYADISEHLRRIDAYTTLWAEDAFARGRRAGVGHAACAAMGSFLRNYLLRGGVRLGETGLIVSALNSHYVFVKLAKLHRLERDSRER